MAIQRLRELASLRHRVGPLSAGVVDAAMASVGTFAVSAYAARFLTPADLGAFALFRSVVFLAGVIPIQGVFTPIQVQALTLEAAKRARMIRGSVGTGFPLTLGSSVLVLIAVPLMDSTATPGSATGLAVTAVLLAIFSPLQTHVRRMAHISERSRSAAYVSSVYAITSVAFLISMHDGAWGRVWLPLGAMAVGNAASLAFSWVLFRTGRNEVAPNLPPFRELWSSGRWLVVVGSISPATTFLSVFLITAVAGAEVMGAAEAVRVVCQPLFVVGTGLSWVLTPYSTKAAQMRNRLQAKRWSRRWYVLIGAISLPYLLIAAWPSGFNPLAQLFPTAYLVPGLVALQIFANTAALVGAPLRAELIGGGRERKLVGAELIGNVPQPVVSVFAFALGAVAKPLADLVSGATLVAAYSMALRGMYPTTGATAETG